MLNFGGLFFKEKKIVFFYHPQNELITYCVQTIHRDFFLFSQHTHLDKRYKHRQHRGMIRFRLMPVVSRLYILGKGVALR